MEYATRPFDKNNQKSNPEGRQEKTYDLVLSICAPWGVENPPVGLSYLASYLRSQGFKVKVLDLNIELYNKVPEKYNALWELKNSFYWRKDTTFKIIKSELKEEIKETINRLLEVQALAYGFSAMDPNHKLTKEAIKELKNETSDAKIFLGGVACWSENSRSDFSDIYNLVDGFVSGEGEYALKEILTRLKKEEDLHGIQNLIIPKEKSSFSFKFLLESIKNCISGKKEKDSYENNCNFPIKDLNKIPFPTYSDFDLEKYHEDSLILLWSRGCMGDCAYCKEKSLWGKSRFRSPRNILKEIKYQIKNNNIRNFVVHDAAINWDIEWIEEICNLIINSDLNINWSAQAVPNFLEKTLLLKLKSAGCHTLIYGIESGSNKILKKMKKTFNIRQAEKVLKWTYEVDIQSAINIIVGFPGEGELELEETVEFLKRNSKYINRVDGLSSLQIVMDTNLHRFPEKYDVILPEEDEYNRWYTLNGNNFQERVRRLKKIDRVCKELNIPIGRNFLYEEKESNKIVDREKLIPFTKLNILMVHPHDIYHVSEPWTVRITNLSEEFVKRRHNVKLIYFAMEEFGAEEGMQSEGYEVIPFCRSCGPKNLLNNINRMCKIMEWADIVHFQKCFYYASIPTIIASWIKKKPLHYDWDDWETEIFHYGVVQWWRKPVGKFMNLLEKVIPRVVDSVSVSSKRLLQECKKLGVSEKKIGRAPVGANLEIFSPSKINSSIREEFGIQSPLVLYLGQLHGAQYAELYIHAAKQVIDSNVNLQTTKFMIIGEGDRLAELKSLTNELKISENIIFTGFVPHKKVPNYLSDADICVACFEDNEITKSKSPLKIVEYLAMGKPIIASNVGEVRNMVGGVGRLVEPGNTNALARAIEELLENPGLRLRMGKRARERAKNKYHWGNTAENLLECYYNVFKNLVTNVDVKI